LQKIIQYIISHFHGFLKKLGFEEQMRYNLVRYGFNTAWMFAEKVLLMAVAFFVGIYVARYLGPEKYGLLNYAISFVTIFKVIAGLGLDNVLIKRLTINKNNKAQILGTVFSIKTLASIFCFIIILIISAFSDESFENKVIIIIIAIGMLIENPFIIRLYFVSIVKAKYNTLTNSAATLIVSISRIIFILLGKDLTWFAFSYLLESIIIAPGILYLYHKKNKDLFKWRFNYQLSRDIMKESWPLLLSGLSVMLYMRIDQIMIKYMLDEKAVGIYSAAVKISEIFYFIPAIIADSVFPAIIKAKNNNINLYNKGNQQLLNLVSIVSFLITIPIFIFSHLIITNLYGIDYAGASNVLKVHVLSFIFVGWGLVSGKWLITENLYKNNFYRTIAGAVVNILANIILIRQLNIIGAAIATLISYIVAGFLFDIFRKETRPSFIMKVKSVNPIAIFNRK
jgi:O-antigen/teichoic acid export membrane protein